MKGLSNISWVSANDLIELFSIFHQRLSSFQDKNICPCIILPPVDRFIGRKAKNEVPTKFESMFICGEVLYDYARVVLYVIMLWR